MNEELRCDFRILVVRNGLIAIADLNKGRTSVTNDAEADRVGVVSSAAWTGRKELPPRKAPVFPYGRTVVLDTDKE